MSEFATTYEYLIGRCHQLGRYGNSCANADNYRTLVRLSITLKESAATSDAKLKEKARKEYDKQLRTIASCIQKALEKALSKFGSKLDDEEKGKFRKFIVELNSPEIDIIEKILVESELILVRHQIYPK